MIPILFEENKTTFNSYGLGALSDALSCVVTEERNGIFELEMEYPVDGIHFEDIKHSRIILAKANEDMDNQAFRIYKITSPINGIVKIYCEHVSYQLSHIPTGGADATNCHNALAGLKNNAYESCPFTFITDNETLGTYTQELPASIRARLGGEDGSILDVYGGEFKWDNFKVYNLTSRGQDRGVTLRYGKNITDIEQEENLTDVYTGVCPYYKGVNEEQQDVIVTLPEHVLHASTASLYPYQRTLILDLSSEFEDTPTETQLRTTANSYMSRNKIGYPQVSITISFVALWQTEEYKDIAPLEEVGLCDYVHVYFEKLGITSTAKVIKTVYNTLLERYDSIELGDAKSSLQSTIAKQISTQTSVMPTRDDVLNAIIQATGSLVDNEEMQAAIADAKMVLEESIDRATSLITGNEGGYVRFIYNSDGLPTEILIMDTQDMDTATKIWRWNKNGLGYSKNGGKTYGLAMTQDGAIVADFITTGTLKAIAISAPIITGGSITGTYIKTALDGNKQYVLDESGLSFYNYDAGSSAIGGLSISDKSFLFGARHTYIQASTNFRATGYIAGLNINVVGHVNASAHIDFFGHAQVTSDYHVRIQDADDDGFHFTHRNGWAYLACDEVISQSSEKVKENIVEISEEDGDKILKLRPVEFDYKWGKHGYGMIAEEVYEVLPDLVSIPEGYDPNTYEYHDFTDKVPNLAYEKFIPYIIRLCQNQQAKIDELEKRIEVLEGANDNTNI